MSDEHAYEAVLAEIQTVAQSAVRRLKMPVEVFIQEALQLYDWAGQDREALVAAGLAWEQVQALIPRAAALRHAQALWSSTRFQQQEARKLWVEQSPEAYELRNTLVHTFRFAFRRRDDLLRVMDAIARGKGHADMLQDLKNLAAVGRSNAALLAVINFDMSLLTRCEEMTEALGRIYAASRNDQYGYREAKQVRDKMAALLKHSVDEIREYGQFLFWRNARRRKGYASAYIRRINRKGRLSADLGGDPISANLF